MVGRATANIITAFSVAPIFTPPKIFQWKARYKESYKLQITFFPEQES